MKCCSFLSHEVYLNCKLEIFKAILLLTVSSFGITMKPNEGQIALGFELSVFMERQTVSFPPALAPIKGIAFVRCKLHLVMVLCLRASS